MPEPTASKLVAEGGKVLLDEADLWPDKKFVITNIIVSQNFLKEHPDVVEAVLRGSVKTNEWINANPDEAKASANAQLEAGRGKAAAAPRSSTRRGSPSQSPTTRWPPRSRREAEHAVKAGLLKKPDLKGIYDLTLLNKVLKAEGKPEVDDAGLGVKSHPRTRRVLPGGDDHGHATAHAQRPGPGRGPSHGGDELRRPYRARLEVLRADPPGSSSSWTTSPSMSRPASSSPSWGPPGCGKSTLLNLVAGLDQPTAGIHRAPGGRPALMFQEHALFPWLTAGKNIELALRLRGVPKAERRAGGGAAARARTADRARTASGCTSCRAACGSASRWPARSPRTASCC